VSSNTNGVNINYGYDAANRLQAVADNRLANSTTYTYDDAGRMLSFAYPNGVTHTFTYDAVNRPTNLTVTSGGTIIASYVHTYGDSGHTLSVNENSSRLVNYSYDQAYRLLTETFGSDSLAYTLDPAGNRTNRTSTLPSLPTLASAYDSNDRLTSDTYDNNGNTLSSGGNTYTYDFEDRLTNFNNGAVTMSYDGDGNRVARTEGGVTTRYLVDDLTPTGFAQVAEEVQGGAVVRRYTYGIQRASQAQPVSGTWIPRYYGLDAGFSTRQLLDASGVVTDTYDYDAFGSTTSRTGTTANPFQYRGEQLDSALGMYYLRARYYDPSIGRFLTRDAYEGCPSKCCNNLYTYPSDDPVNRVDPSGYADAALTYGQIALPSSRFTALLKGAEVATDVCLLGYATSALSIATMSGDYEITGITINFCFVQARVNWRDPRDRAEPRPDKPRKPYTGRCTPERRNYLQNQIDTLCKASGQWSCSGDDSCTLLDGKIAAASACFAARMAIGVECYDFADVPTPTNGGHPHLQAIKESALGMGSCIAIAQAKQCFGGQ
jgi:RHS repeat-associated protein